MNEQEVGCVPSTAVAVCLGGGGGLPKCMLGYTPRGQNDRQVQKHYLAATTLRTVNILNQEVSHFEFRKQTLPSSLLRVDIKDRLHD